MADFIAEYTGEEDEKTMGVLTTCLKKIRYLPKDEDDKALIKRLMDAIFYCRRKTLINDLVKVQIITDGYPFIGNKEDANYFFVLIVVI